MHTLTNITFALLLCAAAATSLRAQDTDAPEPPKNKKGGNVTIGGSEAQPVGKFYWTSGLDAAIFQSSQLTKNFGHTSKLTTLRFSYVVNVGMNLNFDFSKNVGLFLPVDVKNIGFIDKIGDSTVKRRSYNVGAGLGVKVGNLRNRMYGFAGGGVDLPFNYREKGFIKRDNKEKFSEWFSDRTPNFMPYVFAGLSVDPGITLKLQYYPSNFLNPDYTDGSFPPFPNNPYAGYKVNLFFASVGINIKYKKQQKEDYSDMEQPAEKVL